MARERHVFPTGQVAHVWAQLGYENGGVQNGRNGQGNLFFEGDTIFSYGHHFPIAKIVRHPRDGRRAVYFTTRTYSVTTSKHLSIVYRALHGTDQVFNLAPQFWGTPHKDSLKEYRLRLDAAVLKASRARSNQEWLIESAQDLAAEANSYAVFHGLSTRFRTEFPAEFLKGAADRARVESVKKAKAIEKKNRGRARLTAKAIDMWVAGATLDAIRAECGQGVSSYNYSGPVRMRVEGDEIVTTKNARVPVAHAARVWKFVTAVRLACAAGGTEYKRNGHTEHVGQFAIDRVAADGTLTAGCHIIEYAELARIAGLLGLVGV